MGSVRPQLSKSNNFIVQCPQESAPCNPTGPPAFRSPWWGGNASALERESPRENPSRQSHATRWGTVPWLVTAIWLERPREYIGQLGSPRCVVDILFLSVCYTQSRDDTGVSRVPRLFNPSLWRPGTNCVQCCGNSYTCFIQHRSNVCLRNVYTIFLIQLQQI